MKFETLIYATACGIDVRGSWLSCSRGLLELPAGHQTDIRYYSRRQLMLMCAKFVFHRPARERHLAGQQIVLSSSDNRPRKMLVPSRIPTKPRQHLSTTMVRHARRHGAYAVT